MLNSCIVNTGEQFNQTVCCYAGVNVNVFETQAAMAL